MHYSKLTERIAGEGAAAWNIHTRALARQAQGEDIILLSVGDPDFDTPDSIVESAVTSLRGGATHYAEVQGKVRLRDAIAQRYQSQGVPVQSDNVVVMAGAQCCLYAAAQCILDPGDEVIVPEPGYVTYEAVIQSTGSKLVQIPLRGDQDFRLNAEDVAAAITPRTRAILVNSPHNPTGQLIDRATWEALAELCQKHDLWLISDEVYANLIFQGEHICPTSLPGMAERTIVVSSLSKSHAMTGWRVGWAIGPDTLAGHLGNLALCMLYGCPDFIQDAAIHALEHPPEALELMRTTYQTRRDTVCAAINTSASLQAVQPAAGMFVMIDIRATGLSSQAFADQLLAQYDVSLLSGEAFGPSAAGFVRLSLTVDADTLNTACERIVRFAAQLSDAQSGATQEV